MGVGVDTTGNDPFTTPWRLKYTFTLIRYLQVCHTYVLHLSCVCHTIVCMGYTARDLQREGKKILDQADIAPVIVRRGNVFYQVMRVDVQLGENTVPVSGNVYTPVEQPTESEFVPDSQEWSPQLQAMMDSGIIRKGL